MIVLSESSSRPYPTANARDITVMTETAKLAGCRVVYIPPTFDDCGTADNALAHVAMQTGMTDGVLLGYIPTLERYTAIYRAALAKRIRLLNDPVEFQRAMEFDLFYPLIRDLTPRSVLVQAADQCPVATASLGYPVFVKGLVKSRKQEGWAACVAHDDDELLARVIEVLAQPYRSHGKAVVRQLVRLRHTRTSQDGFPFGREYRVFLYNGQPLAHGYYWEGEDALRALTPEETRAVLALAVTAARRLAVPYLVADIGQLETGEWVVIEVGDAQFAGHNDISTLALWNALLNAIAAV